MAESQTNGTTTRDPDTYAAFSRWQLELEFVQALCNPRYLHHLASHKHLDDPAFVRYLAYLSYWRETKYLKYLQYPAFTLKALELLQHEQFRKDILSPAVVQQLEAQWFHATTTTARPNR